jgi:DNA-binding GntR family transcriptional regulator
MPDDERNITLTADTVWYSSRDLVQSRHLMYQIFQISIEGSVVQAPPLRQRPASSFVPLMPPSFRDLALGALQTALIRGELPAGEPIDFPRIAAALGMRTTPVKEAAAVLVQYGLLEVRPRRGTWVRSITEDSLRQSCEARALLEEWAIRRFAEVAGVGDIQALGNTLTRLDELLETDWSPGDLYQLEERYATLDAEFHRRIIAATQNEQIARLYDFVGIQFQLARAFTGARFEEAVERCRSGQIEHKELYRLLHNGDTEPAIDYAIRHVSMSATRAVKVIRERGEFI